MKSNRANTIINMPEGLILEMENLRSEVHVLQRTVASKTAAVTILHKQLEAARGHQAETIPPLQHKLTQTDGGDLNLIKDMTLGSPERSPGKSGGVSHSSSSSVLAELLSASKRENKALKQDLLDLRCKLHDAQADLKVVRSETPRVPLPNAGPLQQHWHRQERLHLIHSLEELTNKVSELEADVRCLNAEREELLRERHHATATITTLGRQLREAQRESTAVTDTSCLDSDSRKGDESGENVCGRESTCLTNGIGRMKQEVIDHSEDLKSSLATAEVIQTDGNLTCETDVSSTLLQQNRSLLLKLTEAEMDLKRTKAIVADYELLSSLQAAAHHDHRTLADSTHHRLREGTDPPSTIVSSSLCAPQPAPLSATSSRPTSNAVAADSSATLSVASDCVEVPSSSAAAQSQATNVVSGGQGDTVAVDCSSAAAQSQATNVVSGGQGDTVAVDCSSAAAQSQATNVVSGGQGDPEGESQDVCLQSRVPGAMSEDVCPIATSASDETGSRKTRTNAVTRNEPRSVCQNETVPSSSEVVETLDGTSATDQPDQESEPWDNHADPCRRKSNLGSHSNTKERCQAVASLAALQTRTIEKVNDSKTVPLQSLSAHSFEGPASLRSQDWLSGMDEVSSYSPYCAEGLSISHCIEEIVPIDEIDSYIEEVRRTQSKRASCKTSSSPQHVSNSGPHYTNRDSHQLQEANLNKVDGDELNSSRCSNKVDILSTVRNTHVNAGSNAPVLNRIEGALKPLAASTNSSVKDETERAVDNAFCDYESDDDNFEAELQQWQQSAVGLLTQAQKRGAH